MLHKYTVIVSASSFSALFPPQPDRSDTADYSYDYTCMETLQGLSISELSSVEGRKWRTVYSDSENTKREGLYDTVWPEAFERMEQFIQDTGLSQEDLNMNYDDVVLMP